MTLTRYLSEAQHCANLMVDVLKQRGLQPVVQSQVLTEDDQLVWLILFLNVLALNGRLEAYASPEIIHHLRTVLKGKPVYLSNSTGLRYLVLLSKLPRLPLEVPYPADVERGVFPLGQGSCGPILTRQLRNVLIAGEPGSGKSNFEIILAHTAYRNGARLYLADPDGHTFNPDLWNTVTALPVAESPDDLIGLLEMINAEIARRKVLFQATSDNGVSPADLEAYNRLVAQPLLPMSLIIDEANSYFDHKDILIRLEDLSRRGRKWGLTIILAAHNWRARDVSRALSSMLPTRVCFRVADDTSGMVALNSRRWGKQAMTLRQPGRGILLLDGRYQVFQAYRLMDERMNFPRLADITPLNPIEKEMVVYAQEQLAGCFIINSLAQAMEGRGITRYRIIELAKDWERRGWLTAPRHATDARRITDELRKIAGLERTGDQGEQDRTGQTGIVQEE